MKQGSRCRQLGSVVLLGAVALTGCGGGGHGSTPTSATSTQTLKQVNVHVTRGGAAEAPRSSMVAMIGDLLGWPQVAEADTGVSGCSVTGGGASATTNANGDATLTGVTFPATINVSCPGGQTGSFPVTGVAGAVVKVEVEVGSIDVKVKDQHVSAPVSQPSQPSKPPTGTSTGTQTGTKTGTQTGSHHQGQDD
jgi:hypothetical protein